MNKSSRVIKAVMALAGVRASDIAADLGISRQAVTAVIHGTRRTPRIRAAIATACGASEKSLWGEKSLDTAGESC